MHTTSRHPKSRLLHHACRKCDRDRSATRTKRNTCQNIGQQCVSSLPTTLTTAGRRRLTHRINTPTCRPWHGQHTATDRRTYDVTRVSSSVGSGQIKIDFLDEKMRLAGRRRSAARSSRLLDRRQPAPRRSAIDRYGSVGHCSPTAADRTVGPLARPNKMTSGP